MKKNSILIFITLLTLSSKTISAQSVNSVDSLICHEWKLVLYEEDGDKFPPAPDQKDNKMIFYNDHKVKSVEGNKIQNGVWKYIPNSKLLTITDTETGEIANMKVLKLTNKEMVLEYLDPDGIPLKMYSERVTNK